jgi:hypothetical protein
MGLFDKFKKTQPAVEPEPVPVKKKRKPAAKKTVKKTVKKSFNEPSPKELATQKGEPWVSVINVELDPNNLGSGSFELDWNEYFVLQLRGAGYTGETDEAIVDAWFTELCRNVGTDEGVDMSRRGSGYVNRALRDDGRTEIY